jgi:hypothetical protein
VLPIHFRRRADAWMLDLRGEPRCGYYTAIFAGVVLENISSDVDELRQAGLYSLIYFVEYVLLL